MTKAGKRMIQGVKEAVEFAQGRGRARMTDIEIVDGKIARREVFDGTLDDFLKRKLEGDNKPR